MRQSRAQLRLIEPEPEKAKQIKPSRAQLKALQHLRAGATLVFRSWPSQSVELEPIIGDTWYLIHQSTARILIAYGWVVLEKFDVKKGYYQLHESGAALADTRCEHQHLDEDRIKFLPGRAVCRNCWGVVKMKLVGSGR